jgi:adenylate cyclase class 2
LRKNQSAFLTFKGRSRVEDGVFSRKEIEFEVGDFEAAKRLIEALGFRVVVIYEKFRTTYTIDGLEIALDELPYGDFIEIEGTAGQDIRDLATKLDLNWNRAVLSNYLGLFSKLRKQEKYRFRDLTFENFLGIYVTFERFGVIPADMD